jgi:hypothetical protein
MAALIRPVFSMRFTLGSTICLLALAAVPPDSGDRHRPEPDHNVRSVNIPSTCILDVWFSDGTGRHQ